MGGKGRKVDKALIFNTQWKKINEINQNIYFCALTDQKPFITITNNHILIIKGFYKTSKITVANHTAQIPRNWYSEKANIPTVVRGVAR